jgi:hypothetical protein
MRNSISTALRLFVVAVSATFMVALASPAQAVLPTVYLVGGFGPHSNELCAQSGYAEFKGAGLPHNGSYAMTIGGVIPVDSGGIDSGGHFDTYVDRNGVIGKVKYKVYVLDNHGNITFTKTIPVKWGVCH